ncbi:MAG: hypothetical protein ABI548_05220 [Polyangiaceae bacterium]
MPSKPTLKACRGDAKTLLAFNLPKRATKNVASFSVRREPEGQPGLYLLNELRFETPGDHAQDASEPANSTLNAPPHKSRWLHVPGNFQQGTTPFYGPYTYILTPHYFDAHGSLQAMHTTSSATITVAVGPFPTKGIVLWFTRGFTQPQALPAISGKYLDSSEERQLDLRHDAELPRVSPRRASRKQAAACCSRSWSSERYGPG